MLAKVRDKIIEKSKEIGTCKKSVRLHLSLRNNRILEGDSFG